MRILIVEDDPALGPVTGQGLELEGFVVDLRADGAGAQAALGEHRFDAIVLDLGLPDVSGEQLLRTWREQRDVTPVLVLTARAPVVDRVQLLELGADDYLVKPFDLTELAARLRALGRRYDGARSRALAFGPLALSPMEHVAIWKGKWVDLTKREYRLLYTLLSNRDRVVTRKQLEEAVYGAEEVDSNAIQVHTHKLRRKLAPDLIENVPRVGYRLNPNVESG